MEARANRPIVIKRENGTYSTYKNSEFIPIYLLFPREILNAGPAFVRNLPRDPREYFHNRDIIAIVESELFAVFIVDAIAFLVWPFLDSTPNMEIYSGYDPIWKLAHCPYYWLETMEYLQLSYPVNELYCNAKLMTQRAGYAPMGMMDILLNIAIPYAIERYELQPIIDTVREYRCFEDFDYRNSRQKTDFTRKWYHMRTKHSLISLESFQEDYEDAHYGQRWDTPDLRDKISESEEQIFVSNFLEQLSPRDKEIVQLRMAGLTMEETAKKLGYTNHSGVLKRLRKIGKAYKQYVDNNL